LSKTNLHKIRGELENDLLQAIPMRIAVLSKTNVYPQINKNKLLHTFFTYIFITDNTYHVISILHSDAFCYFF